LEGRLISDQWYPRLAGPILIIGIHSDKKALLCPVRAVLRDLILENKPTQLAGLSQMASFVEGMDGNSAAKPTNNNNNNNPNGSSGHGNLCCYQIDILIKSYLRDRYIIMASSLIAEYLSQW
jgi:hypothetical protein